MVFTNLEYSERKYEKQDNTNFLKDLKSLFKGDRSLFYLTTTEGFVVALGSYIFFVVSSHLISNGASAIFLSWLISITFIMKMLGAYLIRNNINNVIKNIIFISCFLFVFFMSYTNNIYVVFALYLVMSVLREYIEMYLITDITKRSSEKYKGIVRSYSEFVSGCGILITMAIMNFYFDNLEPSSWLLMYSIGFSIAYILYLSSKKSNTLCNYQS